MKKNNVYFFLIIFLLLIGIGIICINLAKTKPTNILLDKKLVLASSVNANSKEDFLESFSNLLTNKPKNNIKNQKVILGGQAIGMSFDTEGAMVIGLNEFLSQEGLVSPAIENEILIGDIIMEIDGKKIFNSSELAETIQKICDKKFTIKIKRGSFIIEKVMNAKYDIVSKNFKLGLWVKDASSGIGTVTFSDLNGNFASLGHPVIDNKTGQIIKSNGGGVYTCQILSIEKGEKGKAGELRGVINNQEKIEEIYENNNYGIYGKFYKDNANPAIEIEVANPDEVKPGKATIYCTLDKGIPQEYEIEIIKASPQNDINDKGIIIRVTDKKLIDLAGGIVQGMSGSPIIQNGKLVGAVTHVFVNDPTKGYGIYSAWMLEVLKNIIE